VWIRTEGYCGWRELDHPWTMLENLLHDQVNLILKWQYINTNKSLRTHPAAQHNVSVLSWPRLVGESSRHLWSMSRREVRYTLDTTCRSGKVCGWHTPSITHEQNGLARQKEWFPHAIAAAPKVSRNDKRFPLYPSWKTSVFRWKYAVKYMAENGKSQNAELANDVNSTLGFGAFDLCSFHLELVNGFSCPKVFWLIFFTNRQTNTHTISNGFVKICPKFGWRDLDTREQKLILPLVMHQLNHQQQVPTVEPRGWDFTTLSGWQRVNF